MSHFSTTTSAKKVYDRTQSTTIIFTVALLYTTPLVSELPEELRSGIPYEYLMSIIYQVIKVFVLVVFDCKQYLMIELNCLVII